MIMLYKECNNLREYLNESALLFTALTEEALEALAQASAVVTETTARAVKAFSTTITTHRVRARGALTLRAVRTTEASVTLASKVALSIVGQVVGLGVRGVDVGIRNEVLLGLADTMSRAVTGADSSLASITRVTISALTNTGNSIANTTAGALRDLVGSVRVRVVERNTVVVGNLKEYEKMMDQFSLDRERIENKVSMRRIRTFKKYLSLGLILMSASFKLK